MPERRLYAALDHNDLGRNLELAQGLAASDVEGDFGLKVNQDHAMKGGQSYILSIVKTGRPVFVDLKMNNGPRTMTDTILWLGDLGVAHTNIWAHAESNLRKTMDKVAGHDRPDILAATFYTRWDEDYAQRHHRMSLDELVEHWARVGTDNGADGIILPGTMLGAVSDLDTTKLIPAVRIGGEAEAGSDQEQVSDLAEVIRDGADIVVVGSPIYKATDPVEALRTHLGVMRQAEAA